MLFNASASVFVKQGIEELYPTEEQISASNVEGGTTLEVERAVEYILGCGNYDICYSVYEIYSEETLRSLLDSGTPIILCSGWYFPTRQGGHATMVYDYYYDDTNEIFMYNIYDPGSVNVGSTYAKSYENICNGNNQGFPNENISFYIWEGVVVFNVGSYLNTIVNDELQSFMEGE